MSVDAFVEKKLSLKERYRLLVRFEDHFDLDESEEHLPVGVS